MRGLLPWAEGGMVAPVLACTAAMSGQPWLMLGALALFFYPTWLFLWFAMGSSRIGGFALFSATALGNVLIFVIVGAVFRRFASKGPVRQVEIAAAVYVTIYIAVTVIAYQIL